MHDSQNSFCSVLILELILCHAGIEKFTDISYSEGLSSRYIDVGCRGNESRLIDCEHDEDRNRNSQCSPKRVGVRCHEESKHTKYFNMASFKRS